MPRCSFCKQVYEFPKGLTLVLNDGHLLYFCSSKCKNNQKLGRDPKKVNWIKREKKGRKEVQEEGVGESVEERIEATNEGQEPKEKTKDKEEKVEEKKEESLGQN